MIGQKFILDKIDSYTVETLPRSLLLVGENGCGKHTLCKYICDRLNIKLYDFSDFRKLINESDGDTTLGEMLSEFYRSSFYNMVVFNANQMYDKDECTILKFLEEPPTHTFIVIITENEWQLLETIRNRCTMLRFERYTQEELEQCISSDTQGREILLKVCTTPGQIRQFQGFDFGAMYEYINLVVDRFERATDSNILNIGNKIAFKSEKDKFDLFAFIKTLLFCAREKYISQPTNRNMTVYRDTCNMYTKINTLGIDKKNVFDNYLINLKLELEGNRG